MIVSRIRSFFSRNLLLGLKTSPLQVPLISFLPFPVFGICALGIGFSSGLFDYGLVEGKIVFFLPFTLLVFPALVEEVFFRGLLIPNDAKLRGAKRISIYLLVSTALFVLWHPFVALMINPAARTFFLNPCFLGITALLGLTCGISYLLSRSLWIPIIIHWLTVLVWVIFLGGRNMILD